MEDFNDQSCFLSPSRNSSFMYFFRVRNIKVPFAQQERTRFWFPPFKEQVRLDVGSAPQWSAFHRPGRIQISDSTNQIEGEIICRRCFQRLRHLQIGLHSRHYHGVEGIRSSTFVTKDRKSVSWTWDFGFHQWAATCPVPRKETDEDFGLNQ